MKTKSPPRGGDFFELLTSGQSRTDEPHHAKRGKGNAGDTDVNPTRLNARDIRTIMGHGRNRGKKIGKRNSRIGHIYEWPCCDNGASEIKRRKPSPNRSTADAGKDKNGPATKGKHGGNERIGLLNRKEQHGEETEGDGDCGELLHR